MSRKFEDRGFVDDDKDHLGYLTSPRPAEGLHRELPAMSNKLATKPFPVPELRRNKTSRSGPLTYGK
jgi:hypothetical protein